MTPLTYLDFDLAIETLDSTTGRYRVRVLNSPAGQASGDFASPYGVLDMAGNVWEWTRSQVAEYPRDFRDSFAPDVRNYDVGCDWCWPWPPDSS